MSQVKISELPLSSAINANTLNTLFAGVDIPTSATFKMTAHTLAQGLYSNEVLNVGNSPVNLPNTVAQYSASGQSYVQTNFVNTNDGGSADIVITANANSGGTDSTNFIDMGYANKFYQPGLEFNNIGTAINPLDGYLYVQGTAASNGGNLIIGTTTSNTEMRFIVGGGSSANIVAKMTANSLVLNTQSFITFADGTKQLTAANPANYSTASFAQANSAAANTIFLSGALATTNANTVFTQGVDNTQNTWISSNAAFSQAAFTKANNALANATGIFAGDLTITGNTNIFGTDINIVNSTFPSTQSLVQITAANNGAYVAPSNTNYILQLTGRANSVTQFVVDSFGTNTYPLVTGRMGRGSADSPAAVANNDVMLRIAGNGYTGTQFPSSSPTKIDFVASENFSDTNRGTQIQFWNTPVGSNTIQRIASFNATEVQFTGYVKPDKGFILNPLTYNGAQTAITIDFANNATVRATTSTGCTVSFANFVTGKFVDLWLTNTSGQNQTFTHGCSAVNSTTSSTSYAIPSNSTICARYMSFDGDAANTFVSVIHA